MPSLGNRARLSDCTKALLAVGCAAWLASSTSRGWADDATRAELATIVSVDESDCSYSSSRLPRPGDELWHISSRHVGGCPDLLQVAQQLTVKRYNRETEQWDSSSFEAFVEPADPSLPTTLYVHGNRVNSGEAYSIGWSVYRALVGGHQVEGQEDRPPLRFAIWSWPATQIRGPMNDLRAKAARTEMEGYLLGTLLSQMPDGTPLGLIGFSYGARVATGAMHVLGGGALSGRSLLEPNPDRLTQVTSVLYAAAVHSHWLAPGNYHDQALAGGGVVLNLYNCCDPALKRYRFVSKCSNPAALGYCGLAGRHRLPDDARYEQVQVSRCVGCGHELCDYLRNTSVMQQTREALDGAIRLTP